jgi:hypothetical protein
VLTAAQRTAINRQAPSSSGFPLTGTEIVVALLAIALLALTALGMRRIALEKRREATRDFLRSRQATP